MHRQCVSCYLILSTSGPSIRLHSSCQSANNLSAKTIKRARKRRANFPMERLMEQFLEQSTQAEDNFYRVEEQRLQAEDRRREAEHARELHMLQMLGQMFSSISSVRSVVTLSKTAAPPAAPPVFYGASPSRARAQSGHIRCPSPLKDCFAQQSHLLNPGPHPIGISFGVVFPAWRRWCERNT